ncbi:arginyl-tRNA synthetase [Desulfonispora thiosulfatigenes DSM 11270]|uniref:Arginine--tRNA ligase n=1 Tax=Desulfonispora thiosulfatigenes DSM 11270 TaxID=656914 RepID=A0A1W1UZ66_DESTI|nr:arginyl-tRNA synthetase [Desulfonispora thiosulfatigenes DSM 11270]
MSIVEKVKNSLGQQLENSLATAKEQGLISYEDIPNYVLEVPREETHGNFAANIAMLMAKEAKMSPRKIADIIVANIGQNEFVEKVEIAGPGFINFYLNNNWLYEGLKVVDDQDEKYGCSEYGKGKKIQVEFVSANPTGLLHMGNARGGALGDSLSNMLACAGYNVTKEFYINDAGKQIENFGKSLEARYLQELGQDVPFPEDGYHGVDIIDTVKTIIKDKKDSLVSLDTNERQAILVELGLKEKVNGIKEGLADFGVNYDIWFYESALHNSGAIKEVVELLQQKDLVYEQEGAMWFRSSKFNTDDKDEVLIRSNGVPTYFAADIAYHRDKFLRGFDQVVNIWGADHHGHVARMKGAMEAIGYDSDRLTVVLMQLVRLYRGEEIVRMSKRTGQYVTLSELIDEIGKDAARYFFTMRNPDTHLEFDLDLAKKNSNENPVFYVQYAHARICSILKMTGEELPKAKNANLSLLKEKAEIDLIRKIVDFPVEIVEGAKSLEPHVLTRYAHDLASTFHSFYNCCRVLSEDKALSTSRTALVNATRITLRNVLTILGVSAPERM